MADMFSDVFTRPSPAPLITYYEGDARVELSGVTFSNWVMKTANFFDDLGGESDEALALGLADTHPGHWVSLIWTAATWFAGGQVVAGVPEGAALAVIGPEDERRGDVTVACSLHPLGLGFDAAPAGCVDYADVLAQPDAAVEGMPAPTDLAWGAHSYADLDSVEGRSSRLLFSEPTCSWAFLRDALVAPLLGGGSSVVAVGLDEERVREIAVAERASISEA